jgi:hypothetical protein
VRVAFFLKNNAPRCPQPIRDKLLAELMVRWEELQQMPPADKTAALHSIIESNLAGRPEDEIHTLSLNLARRLITNMVLDDKLPDRK